MHYDHCCSVVQSCLTLRPHGLQHARLPCPSLSLGVCWNSCPLGQWWHPTITPFSCPQPFPASVSFPMSRLFVSGSQSIGHPASASVLPMNIQGWFPLGWTSLISLLFKGLYPVLCVCVCVCVCECPSPHSSSILPQGVGGLPDHRYGSSWVPSKLRNSHLEGQSCWWLWQSCLLIQQEILHFSGKGGSSEEVRCGRKS